MIENRIGIEHIWVMCPRCKGIGYEWKHLSSLQEDKDCRLCHGEEVIVMGKAEGWKNARKKEKTQ